jgi:aspartate/methionine/tyrosine aminotransferase
MHQPSDRVLQFKDSIFGIMSAKAREAGAINLSQGFPDFDGPEFVKAAVLEEIKKGNNQYAPFPGTPNLRSSVSDYIKKYYDISYDPNTEITVSCGATEGIFLSILSTVNPGDEVIVFEPFYDSYVSSILTAGGIPVPICIKGPDFTIPYEELESKINSKTKLVIFNNPYNPVGRVFSKYELENLAKIIKNTIFFL